MSLRDCFLELDISGSGRQQPELPDAYVTVILRKRSSFFLSPRFKFWKMQATEPKHFPLHHPIDPRLPMPSSKSFDVDLLAPLFRVKVRKVSFQNGDGDL
ncbi:hypothetical protein LSTR_LSTR008074 [Laodelphax striatellus]|uniref:Uncharacterized protein n=1 Tax=Laodelphax striatellus TaxID=195883 RepID=A0A482WPX6_LAOST|nr:hypothetical protein LSTR_LSTR008074 [Laodelphax striatellus]